MPNAGKINRAPFSLREPDHFRHILFRIRNIGKLGVNNTPAKIPARLSSRIARKRSDEAGDARLDDLRARNHPRS